MRESSLISVDAAVGQLQLVLEGNAGDLDGGWQTLVDGLVAASSTAGTRLMVGERALAVAAGEGGTWEVTTPARTVRAASLVIAPGGPDAARALLPRTPTWELGSPATAACLDLGLRSPPVTKVAFGLDEPLYLSTHSPSARLVPLGGALVHVMRYGARTSGEDRAQLWALAERCGVTEGDVVVQRFLHEMTVCHALLTARRRPRGPPRHRRDPPSGRVPRRRLGPCWRTPPFRAGRQPDVLQRNERRVSRRDGWHGGAVTGSG